MASKSQQMTDDGVIMQQVLWYAEKSIRNDQDCLQATYFMASGFDYTCYSNNKYSQNIYFYLFQ